MCLNYPQTILPSVYGKIVLHETSPWCRKDWGPLTYYSDFVS